MTDLVLAAQEALGANSDDSLELPKGHYVCHTGGPGEGQTGSLPLGHLFLFLRAGLWAFSSFHLAPAFLRSQGLYTALRFTRCIGSLLRN